MSWSRPGRWRPRSRSRRRRRPPPRRSPRWPPRGRCAWRGRASPVRSPPRRSGTGARNHQVLEPVGDRGGVRIHDHQHPALRGAVGEQPGGEVLGALEGGFRSHGRLGTPGGARRLRARPPLALSGSRVRLNRGCHLPSGCAASVRSRPLSSHLEARAKTERAHEAPAAAARSSSASRCSALVSAALDGLTAGRGAASWPLRGRMDSGKSAVLDVVSREARGSGHRAAAWRAGGTWSSSSSWAWRSSSSSPGPVRGRQRSGNGCSPALPPPPCRSSRPVRGPPPTPATPPRWCTASTAWP